MIADLPKMMVYRVARWRNQRDAIIPEAVLTKAPSAELKPDQKDQDTLPPYEVLDEILERHVEQCQGLDEIVARGFDATTVGRVLRMFKNAEFERKQFKSISPQNLKSSNGRPTVNSMPTPSVT